MKKIYCVLLLMSGVYANAQSSSRIEVLLSGGITSNLGNPVAPVNISRSWLSGNSSTTYYGVSEESEFISRQAGVMISPWFNDFDRVSIGLGIQYHSFESYVRADSVVKVSTQYNPAVYSREVTKGVVWKVSQHQFQIPVRVRIFLIKKEKHRVFADLGVLLYKYSNGTYPAGVNVNADEITGKFSTGFEGGLGYTNVYSMDKNKLLLSAGLTLFQMFKPITSEQQIQFAGLRVAAGLEWKHGG